MKAHLQKQAIRNLRLRFVLSAFLGILMAVAAPGAYAQTKVTVRGRIDRQRESKRYPAAYVAVSLASRAGGGDQSVSTGGDGMYHIHDVTPGQYTLQVLDQGKVIRAFAIQVSAGQRYVDIAPIVIP
jgi:hypothetical protein